LAYRRILS